MNIRRMAMHHLALLQPPRRVCAGSKRSAMNAMPLPWISSSITYIICTSPRSGSWLLSEGLASTSLAGNPREWFHGAQEQEERARWRLAHSTDLTFARYLEHVRSRATSPNGICGVKLHYYQ